MSDTKIVRITVSALTRVEYSTTVEVPADAPTDELEDLAEKIYQETDGGEFQEDPDYWERGSRQIEDVDEHDQPDEFLTAVRDPDDLRGWQTQKH